MSIAVPDPWGTALQEFRIGLGDPQASGIPTHITLLPPMDVDAQELPVILDHLATAAAAVPAFPVRLRGTGTFRPVSEVVFVAVVCALVTVAFGVFPEPLFDIARDAGEAFSSLL